MFYSSFHTFVFAPSISYRIFPHSFFRVLLRRGFKRNYLTHSSALALKNKNFFQISEQKLPLLLYITHYKSFQYDFLFTLFFKKLLNTFKFLFKNKHFFRINFNLLWIKKFVFKKLYLLLSIYLKNLLISNSFELNSKFFTFFYFFTKPFLNNKQFNFSKFLFRNLFFSFIFFKNRLDFFFSLKKKISYLIFIPLLNFSWLCLY